MDILTDVIIPAATAAGASLAVAGALALTMRAAGVPLHMTGAAWKRIAEAVRRRGRRADRR